MVQGIEVIGLHHHMPVVLALEAEDQRRMIGLLRLAQHVAKIAQGKLRRPERHELRLRFGSLDARYGVALFIIQQEPALGALDRIDSARHPIPEHRVRLLAASQDFLRIEHRHVEDLRGVPTRFGEDDEPDLGLPVLTEALVFVHDGKSVDFEFSAHRPQLVLPVRQCARVVADGAGLVDHELPRRRAGIEHVVTECRIAVIEVVSVLESGDLGEDRQRRHLGRLEIALLTGAKFIGEDLGGSHGSSFRPYLISLVCLQQQQNNPPAGMDSRLTTERRQADRRLTTSCSSLIMPPPPRSPLRTPRWSPTCC